MKELQILNLLEAYYAMGTLKFQEDENSSTERKESIADKVFGAQQWAWLLWSEFENDLDIFKVNAMLSLSEISKSTKTPTILIGGWEKQGQIYSLINEVRHGQTQEALFARFCKRLNEDISCLNDMYDYMPQELIDQILEVGITLNSLKQIVRKGVINWNITGIRRESISEHVYSVQQLAWLMWLLMDIKMDIFKVVAMLSIHETEETIIGDISPYCGITPEEKLKMGHEAVEKLLGKLRQFDMMYSLIKEFDAEKTVNAYFAHLCDKLDCDLAIKYYSDGGYCSIENATDAMKNNPKIQKLIADGAKTVADAFIMADKHMYSGTEFEEVLNVANDCDVTKFLL